jgi:hypothetical protein
MTLSIHLARKDEIVKDSVSEYLERKVLELEGSSKVIPPLYSYPSNGLPELKIKGRARPSS